MKHASYCLYRKKEKNCVMWYAKFWDYEKRRYWAYRTLKVKASGKYLRRTAAREAAEDMLGGLQKSAPADESFAGFLARFWERGGIGERAHFLKTRKKMSQAYLKSSALLVKKHIAPNRAFLANSAVQLSAGMVHDFMADKAKQGASEDLINKCIKAMRVATRYLFERGELKEDPMRRVRDIPAKAKEKGVLDRAETERLTRAEISGAEKAGVLLGALCGMRLGEIRGLTWGDIGGGKIEVKNNWQDMEGNKLPKCGSTRVSVLPDAAKNAVERLQKTGSLIFASKADEKKPLSTTFFRVALKNALSAIGIDAAEQRRRNITFHSLRHTFITNGVMAGISGAEIRALAGHKSTAMTERYTHAAQVMDYERICGVMSGYFGA